MNTTEKLKLAIAYIFSWLGGLIIFFTEAKDRFIRFHAVQSIFIGLLPSVLSLIHHVFGVFGDWGWYGGGGLGWTISWPFRVLRGLISVLNSASWLVWLVLMIICLVHALRGEMYKLPIIGDRAEDIANRN